MKFPRRTKPGLYMAAAIFAIIGFPAAQRAMAGADEETIRRPYTEWTQVTNDKDIEAWAAPAGPQ